ncbi:hypothetical protein MTO96_040744 [Rhipicephalus appendiculatus]
MTDTQRQDLDNMDFQDSTAHSLPTPHGPSDKNSVTGSQNQADGAWQMVLTLRQKKSSCKKRRRPNQWIWPSSRKLKHRPAYRRLPPLPKDDFKIVVRPHQGLPVKNLTSPLLADAVLAACSGQISGEQFFAPNQARLKHLHCVDAASDSGGPR